MNQPIVLSSTALPTRVRYGVLGWVCSLSMLTYIDRVAIKSVRGSMQSELGLSNEQFAYIFAAFGLSYALFEVPSGWLGDRIGPRKVLARIVLWWSLFTVLTGCVWNFAWLNTGLRVKLPFSGIEAVLFDAFVLMVLVRFLFGLGEAGAYPNIARAMKSWFPYRQRGRGQGLCGRSAAGAGPSRRCSWWASRRSLAGVGRLPPLASWACSGS